MWRSVRKETSDGTEVEKDSECPHSVPKSFPDASSLGPTAHLPHPSTPDSLVVGNQRKRRLHPTPPFRNSSNPMEGPGQRLEKRGKELRSKMTEPTVGVFGIKVGPNRAPTPLVPVDGTRRSPRGVGDERIRVRVRPTPPEVVHSGAGVVG